MLINRLNDAVAAVAPIQGVSIGKSDDKSTWRIDFKAEATAAQRVAGQAQLDAFDPTPYNPPTPDVLAADSVDGVDRLQFDNIFQHENAIRALRTIINTLAPGSFTAAQAAQITQAQFRQFEINRWKALNP